MLTFLIRNTSKTFNESKHLSFAIYDFTFVLCLLCCLYCCIVVLLCCCNTNNGSVNSPPHCVRRCGCTISHPLIVLLLLSIYIDIIYITKSLNITTNRFVCAVLIPLLTMLDNVDAQYLILCLGIIFGTSAAYMVIIFPKFWMIISGQDEKFARGTMKSRSKSNSIELSGMSST